MGALVATVNKKGENVVPTVVATLGELTHRGKAGHGIATPDMANTAATLEELEHNNHVSSIAIGHNLSCSMSRDQLQPVEGDGFTAVFEGRLFPAPNLPGVSEAQALVGKLGSNPLRNAGSILEKLDGSYVFAFAESNRIVAGRDVFGATPIYYGKNETYCVVASERKTLWNIGLKDVQDVLSSHEYGVCCHWSEEGEDAGTTWSWAADLGTRTLKASLGPPCEKEYTKIGFD